eukprot:TRINITY_DN30211_c0_g1_i1.p1 TRINITY_DN30211_c0_g1~~TRINITY_DN30211_c0_g1_i1.p1  ORF type:complete len:376 (-),score=49.59 TRINITY_DN30211_c0_g1_i1:145-1272(-)
MAVALRRLSKVSSQVVAAEGGQKCFSSGRVDATLPRVYLGTMTFAWEQASSPVDVPAASAMVNKFLSVGGVEIDTARIYSEGRTEPILAQALETVGQGASYRLATKVHPSQPSGLSAKGIRAQLEASLKALHVDRVDTLYLHQPDPEHDLTESLQCVHDLIQEGKVGALGISNYSAIETERMCALCKEHGWSSPSYFQGLYNPLNRLVEESLLPVLRKYQVGFIAFNPLAAGMLTGKHHQGGEVMGGRFKNNPNYLPRFYTEDNFKAVEGIRSACEAHGLELVPATYAWLLRHSKLDASKGDGLLLGASTVAQLDENLAACTSSSVLPEPVVTAFDAAFDICKSGAFPYWRSYSRDQPGRETLHPGASYTAHGPK